ncbi:hypothetical protein DSM106972_014030 [Dulcicalothrix desertica PCC 7102]|uniref:Uncharacterized protein n=1 Tax=Dulcicalothrix desertica PCC 7102 TaxID=232991 RepID=A0A433VQC8_9CYAN|nr:hypothetical protein [Dulcicalothrix desertica]RUT08235.1 hypothetical protein DSM106972_014030 [Dulcicalothrix desertica PCC 7102]TWH40105.1 hypothetical protein CAL7102_09402 [Dulcicalothrix desertica PCC 7102]
MYLLTSSLLSHCQYRYQRGQAAYYIEVRKARGNWDKFRQVLSKVPDVEPEDYDKLA